MPQRLSKLINDDEVFRVFLLKLNDAQELEKSARKMLERTLSSFESVDELGLHVNWLTLRDARTGVSEAYEKNELDKEDVIRAAKVTYLRQTQFMMVLVYEAFEELVKNYCSENGIFTKGNFRFPENFKVLMEKFPALAELKLLSGHGDFLCSKLEHGFYFWELVYLVRDLRQVVVHEHGRVESFDMRFRKLQSVEAFSGQRLEFLKDIYTQFFKPQSGFKYVWTAVDDGLYESNFSFILERLKSYAYFMAQTCLVVTDRQ